MEQTNQQQMDLITEMIQAARKGYNDNGSIYLLWGWMVCFAALIQYTLILMHNDLNYIGWAVLMPLAGLIQIIIMSRQKRHEKMKTHIDRVIGYVWIAVGMSIGMVCLSGAKLQMNMVPMLLMLYAIGTFISGGVLKLRIMLWGASFCWVIGIICFYVSFENQLLLLAVAVMLSYIIPGYALMARSKKNV